MKQTRSDYVREVSGAIKTKSLLLQVMGVQYANVVRKCLSKFGIRETNLGKPKLQELFV